MIRLRTRFETLDVAELADPYHPGTSQVREVVKYNNDKTLRAVYDLWRSKEKKKQ